DCRGPRRPHFGREPRGALDRRLASQGTRRPLHRASASDVTERGSSAGGHRWGATCGRIPGAFRPAGLLPSRSGVTKLVLQRPLAVEFRSALEHVVGPQQQIEAVTIGPEDDVEQRRKDIIEAVKRVDSGEGVAILTDMFGGTPSNLAISVMSRPKVEVLAGINLPMLVKLAKIRDESPLHEAVTAAQEAG